MAHRKKKTHFPLESLPQELIIHIISMLDMHDTLSIGACNRILAQLSCIDLLWQPIFSSIKSTTNKRQERQEKSEKGERENKSNEMKNREHLPRLLEKDAPQNTKRLLPQRKMSQKERQSGPTRKKPANEATAPIKRPASLEKRAQIDVKARSRSKCKEVSDCMNK